MKMSSALVLLISNLALAQAPSPIEVWQRSGQKHEIAVAIIAPGLTAMDIYSQVGILLANDSPISKIVIQNPDLDVEDVALELQARYPKVQILVENGN